MKKYIIFSLLTMTTAMILGQIGLVPPDPLPITSYDGKTPPALKLDEAYAKALLALGDATNQYYCVGSTCMNPVTLAGSSGPFYKGWMFEFSSTNGTYKHVHVSFDKTTTALVGDGADYQQSPATNIVEVGTF